MGTLGCTEASSAHHGLGSGPGRDWARSGPLPWPGPLLLVTAAAASICLGSCAASLAAAPGMADSACSPSGLGLEGHVSQECPGDGWGVRGTNPASRLHSTAGPEQRPLALPCRRGPDRRKITHARRGAAVWCRHVRWEPGAWVFLLGDAAWSACCRRPGPAHAACELGSRGRLPSAFSHCIFCLCCWMASWTRASIMASVRTPSSEAYAMAWQGKGALRQGSRGAARVGEGPQPEASQGPPVTTHPCRPGPDPGTRQPGQPHPCCTCRPPWRCPPEPNSSGAGAGGGKTWAALRGLRSAAGGAWPLSPGRTPTRGRTHTRSQVTLQPRAAAIPAPPAGASAACSPGFLSDFRRGETQRPAVREQPSAQPQTGGPCPVDSRAALRAREQPTEPPQATQTPERGTAPGAKLPSTRSTRGPTVCRWFSQNRGLLQSRPPAALCTRDAQAPRLCTWAGEPKFGSSGPSVVHSTSAAKAGHLWPGCMPPG